ncbi:MerR family transcriptional regulator [Paludisphaera soli]|uniref:MerR family transcriptional regulator n=1 Tax=Paludisphaera soli TaxID=2712865 RepID=UPI0013EC144B|nr:MerR family transcriptional regulator [Paludisphaera soli]
MTMHYLLGEVAVILGCRPHQIDYQLKTRQVPEPEKRIANKRLFSERDILRLARKLRVEPDWSVVERASEPAAPDPAEGLALRPPFEVVRVGESGCEVRDGDGAVFAWASDRAKALIIAGLLEGAVL